MENINLLDHLPNWKDLETKQRRIVMNFVEELICDVRKTRRYGGVRDVDTAINLRYIMGRYSSLRQLMKRNYLNKFPISFDASGFWFCFDPDGEVLLNSNIHPHNDIDSKNLASFMRSIGIKNKTLDEFSIAHPELTTKIETSIYELASFAESVGYSNSTLKKIIITVLDERLIKSFGTNE